MNVDFFKLPKLDFSQILIIEQKYCELLNKYRANEIVDVEIIDWMDSANTFLETCRSIDNERS